MEQNYINTSKKITGTEYHIDPELLSNITHQLAHDIGNPLTSIITYGSIIEQADKLNVPSDKLSEYAKSMLSETWKISILMEKFTLLVSKKVSKTSTSLQDISTKILSRYINRYGLKEFDIELIGFDNKLEVNCESEQLTSLLCELIVNAANELKYLAAKGQEQDYYLVLKATETANSTLTFSCENNSERYGDELEKLFTPGYSNHQISKKSLGLGLTALSHSALRWGGVFTIEEVSNEITNKFIANLSLKIS